MEYQFREGCPGGRKEIINMLNRQFEKETFKQSVKDNVKMLFRKTIEEADPQPGFPGGVLFCKRRDY